ncbi:protein LATERAL ORGAN BOUNDARIES [Ricinus communis]|nr:protein LATERAL ORGAN BOUNDARIES [Ricinus communis]
MRDMQRNGNNGTAVPGTHAACASCKHQRKKCGEDCILHPYFPAEKSQEFQAVHRVFGVSNVMKLIRSVGVEDRQRLAESLIWEASCRQKDPVLGPFGEYTKVSDELKLYKTHMLTQTHQHHQLVTVANHQNQLLMPPTPPQQSMMYKPPIGWHGANGMKSAGIGRGGGGGYAYSHDNGNIDPASCTYTNFSYNNNNNVQGLDKVKKQERDVSTRLVTSQQPLQQQHHSVTNSFSEQQYYLSGQYGSINGKKMDTTLWETGP